MSEFKVGDIIKCICGSSICTGKEFKITVVGYSVYEVDGVPRFISKESAIMAEAASSIDYGDTVTSELFLGTGYISEILDDLYEVSFKGSKNKFYVPKDRVTLHTDTVVASLVAKYKIGDVVDKGTVFKVHTVGVPKVQYTIKATEPKFGYAKFWEDELTLNVEPKFKVGDQVVHKCGTTQYAIKQIHPGFLLFENYPTWYSESDYELEK